MISIARGRAEPVSFDPPTGSRQSAVTRLAPSLASRVRRLRPAERTVPEPGSDPAAREHVAPTRLPLYHRQGSIVLLDDAPDYLELLVPALPRQWNIETFLSAQSCLNYLQQEPPRWEADWWAQQRIVDACRAGEPIIPRVLQYWRDNPGRFALTKVCVVDQLMPAMTGLEVLEELVDWPGQRMLVTGEFDAALANAAFNRGVIDYFLPKQTDRIGARLTAAVQSLMNRPDPRSHQIWAATLSPEQMAILRNPSVAQELSDFVSSTFLEWAVIGKPFGIIGLNAAGLASWLQLQPASGLDQLAELARAHGASPEDLAHIRAGRCVHDAQLRADLGNITAPSTTPAFYVGDSGTLLAGIHRINETAPPIAFSYSNWLRNQARRRAENQSQF